MDQFETQVRIMQQSNAMQESIQDLYRWEKEMKQKENLSHQTAVASETFDSEFPIRSEATSAPVNTPSIPNTSQIVAGNGSTAKKVPPSIVKTPSTLEKANEFKTRGNDCVKNGQLQKAIHYYTEAIRLNKFDPIYFSNRAHCYLKLNRYLECVEDCTIAIGLDENCVKAYYRRMQAHEQLDGNLVAALSDCETVLRFEPKNSEAKKCLERIKGAMKKQTPAAVPVSKSQIENKNILLRASNGAGIGHTANAAPTETAAPWSKYEGQNDYEQIDFISKPPHLRSKQTLKRIKITETTTCMENGAGDGSANETTNSNSKEKDESPPLSVPTEPSGDTKSSTEIKNAKANTSANVLTPPPTPKSTAQFHKTWLATKSDLQKYAILKSIYNADVAKMLGSQFDVAILSEILVILKQHFVREQQPIANIMLGIVNNMEMSIVALLMNDEDKLAFTKLLAYMHVNGEEAAKVDAIEKKFESYMLAPN